MSLERFPDREPSVSDVERQDKTAGKLEIAVISTFEAYTSSKWPNAIFEISDSSDHVVFLSGIGLKPEQARVRILNGKHDLIDVESDYGSGITAHQIFTSEFLGQAAYELEDLVFVDKTSGQVFSARSIMSHDVSLEIDPTLQFKAWGGPSIQMPPLGRGLPPEGVVDRGRWNAYKKVEALVLFHEIAHSRQSFNSPNTEESVEAERDAWRFGLQCIRRLRELGIDLLPEVSNVQMVSRLELGLLRYDKNHPEDLPKRFSRRFKGNTVSGRLHDFRHLLKFLGAVLKTAKDEPSLVTETLSYRGEK